MKAYVINSFGPPENLLLSEVDKPVPGPGEVLLRVRATSINPYDWHHMRGEPFVARFMGGGLGRRPHPILGCDVAGEVAALGPGVSALQLGDAVYGLVKHGSFAEYMCAPAENLVAKPGALSFEQAAAVPMAGVTARVAVHDNAGTAPGGRVLVNGASGGVGTFAVQLARAAGAEVAGVCSGRNAELVRSLGATEVYDYTKQDFTRLARGFDALVDIAGSPPVRAARRVLQPGGAYVVIGGDAGRWLRPIDHIMAVQLTGALTRQPSAVTGFGIGADSARHLTELAPLFENGQVTPVIARRYAFAELPAAVRFVEAGHAPGKVVVTVASE